jgi:Family of unknown function (DUF6298)
MKRLTVLFVTAPFLFSCAAHSQASAAATDLATATGPLHVLPTNPRYFTDGSGRAIYLTGSHAWDNLQDYSYATLPSPPTLDFGAYLAFLLRNNHNFFRLWARETPIVRDALQGTTIYDPVAYVRTGPGLASDGKPRFDLTKFNAAFFDRMRARVAAARMRGIYVSVMLFEGFSIEGKGNDGGDPWWGHPLNPNNNVNGLDGGGGKVVHTLANPSVTACQETYVRKVIDTVNDLDNVLYEISNEDTGSPADSAWQYHMISFVKGYEAGKPKQHPVGMTVQYPGGDDKILLDSPADWISPGARLPASDGRKVIINDTDHSFFWIGLKEKGLSAQRSWVWENFARGSQCLFMDPYLDPSHDKGRNNSVGASPDTYWDAIRKAMGDTRAYAMRMNLASMPPHEDLASTGFCLANPGREYLVFQPDDRHEFTVNLTDAPGRFSVEWFDVSRGVVVSMPPIEGGAVQTLTAPFEGPSAIYLKR